MEQCIYCRQNTYDRSKHFCTSCGKPKLGFNDVLVVYGKTWSDKCFGRMAFTDKFLIIKKETQLRKGVAASFGLVGAIVASVADPSKGSPLGYYSLSEIKHVIWPYNNRKLKRAECMKIVNRDGSDLILKGELTCTMFVDVVKRFKECNVTVIDGKNQNFGDTYCEKPFVNADTLGRRVSPDAAGVVRMMRENFVAPAIAVPNSEPVASLEAKHEPVAVEDPVAVEEPVAADVKTPEPPVAEPKQTEAETPGAKDYKFCFACGSKLLKTDKFCVECGTRQR